MLLSAPVYSDAWESDDDEDWDDDLHELDDAYTLGQGTRPQANRLPLCACACARVHVRVRDVCRVCRVYMPARVHSTYIDGVLPLLGHRSRETVQLVGCQP